jgi:hypothetical protein
MDQTNSSHDILSASYCEWNYVEKQLDSNTIKHKLFLLQIKKRKQCKRIFNRPSYIMLAVSWPGNATWFNLYGEVFGIDTPYSSSSFTEATNRKGGWYHCFAFTI